MITSLPATTTFTPRQALLSAMEFVEDDRLESAHEALEQWREFCREDAELYSVKGQQ